jgi:Carboxypeptidase regulatory-like domain/TonB dependent receptor
MALRLKLLCVSLVVFSMLPAQAQQVTVYVGGKITDTTGAVVPNAKVSALNTQTGFSRATTSSISGDYQLAAMPVGDYRIAVEAQGLKKMVRAVHLDVGANATIDFALPPGQVTQEINVEAEAEALEPTRSMVSSVIAEREIQTLPVNGRQFIDFALLAPGVTVGDTTSGSTDVIIEPVTKLSFAGQNIHYNFVAIDGADNISTASGIQKTTPSQEAVKEFRVINSEYSVEAGRAVGGIINIITKSGANQTHGSVYEYFRNDKMDATSPLASPGLNKLRQNQYGFTLGGPIQKDKTFYFGNYEGQRRRESPFYNSIILANLAAINQVKTQVFHLAPENLNVTRNTDYDNALFRLDHTFNQQHNMFLRYFFNDQRATNLSPLNDGFDLPSGFKDNNFRDQSIVGSLTSSFSKSLVNELRVQYAHRFFNFPTDTTQPHLEVSNTFTLGVNRGNPDFYEEGRWEVVDNVTKAWGKHTVSFGGNFDHVNTTESFPLFYPFEADFGSLGDFLGTNCLFGPGSSPCGTAANPLPHPFVIFFERFNATNGFNETSFNPAVFTGKQISKAVRNQAKGELGHTYEGLYLQDKWRTTDRLTLNYGLRWEGETWPSIAVDSPLKNFDPRAGFSYNLSTSHNLILRGGAGTFHGILPSPLLMCQIPSCGGLSKYPGRENIQDGLNSTTRLSAFGSDPLSMNIAFQNILNGQYPLLLPSPFGGAPSVALDATIVRFAQKHKPPYGIQTSLGVEFQPFSNAVVDVSYLHVRGVHLGSFFNVNQPNPSGQLLLHDSKGNTSKKNVFCANFPCFQFAGGIIPNIRTFPFAVDFEADSRWDSLWDGLLINFNKRMSKHVAAGISYTWSHGIDNGPNPSFVLIPQDSSNFNAERAVSADDVRHRFVANMTLQGPTHLHPVLNGFQLGLILTLESPHYFTKFAGFDANGDIFGNNDRVGVEARNTFKGDSYQSADIRLSRTFAITERTHLEAMAEAFNLTNTLNVRFFNTAYGASDFCPAGGPANGCFGTLFKEGSPNPSYGTPRAVNNPRQIQLAVRLTF